MRPFSAETPDPSVFLNVPERHFEIIFLQTIREASEICHADSAYITRHQLVTFTCQVKAILSPLLRANAWNPACANISPLFGLEEAAPGTFPKVTPAFWLCAAAVEAFC